MIDLQKILDDMVWGLLRAGCLIGGILGAILALGVSLLLWWIGLR